MRLLAQGLWPGCYRSPIALFRQVPHNNSTITTTMLTRTNSSVSVSSSMSIIARPPLITALCDNLPEIARFRREAWRARAHDRRLRCYPAHHHPIPTMDTMPAKTSRRIKASSPPSEAEAASRC